MTIILGHYNPDRTHMITKELYTQIIGDICNYSVNILPVLSIGDNFGELAEQRVRTYVNMLRKAAPFVK